MDLIKLNPFPNIGASTPFALATDQLKGMSVHAIIFEQSGTFTKAQLTDLRIGAGGKDFLPKGITGTELQSLNDYAGFADTSNYLMHYFGDPTARTVRGQHLGDLDLSVHDGPLNIEGVIGAATGPGLQCYALVGAPKAQMGLGYNDIEAHTTRALIRSILTPTAAVNRQAALIGLGSAAGARIRNIGFFHSNLTSVELKKAGLIEHEDVSIALNAAYETDMGRVPQAGLYVLDRIPDGNQGEAEDTVRKDGSAWNMQVLITTSAGDTINTYADVHALPSML